MGFYFWYLHLCLRTYFFSIFAYDYGLYFRIIHLSLRTFPSYLQFLHLCLRNTLRHCLRAFVSLNFHYLHLKGFPYNFWFLDPWFEDFTITSSVTLPLIAGLCLFLWSVSFSQIEDISIPYSVLCFCLRTAGNACWCSLSFPSSLRKAGPS